MAYYDQNISASVESGDGWAILWRAALHLENRGLSYYDDQGGETALCLLLDCRKLLTAKRYGVQD